ncbi:MAG: hypothetical protein IK115_00520 [Lachnospiraceae bacterium]|nr:hypothetical protein [Lachnospiraceae bacterium]
MGLFRKLREKWDRRYYPDESEWDGEEAWDEEGLEEDRPLSQRGAHYFSDADTRTVYVLEALEQMSEASEKVEQYQGEYDAVTALLMDMEEIEDLPNDMRVAIMEQASKIEKLEKERRQVFVTAGQLDEHRVDLLKRYEDEIPGGVRKMREAEEYRKLVKMDLRKMDAEKASIRYQLREAVLTVSNSRGVAIICGVAMVVAIGILLALQKMMGLDVSFGYILIGGAGAISLTVLLVRYQDAVREIKHLEKLRDKMIGLHNTVKIRFVNNTNLLSYLYMKYGVDNSGELEEDYQSYMEVMGARQKDEKLKEDLEYYYKKLADTLRKSNIKDPEIWTRQARALVDPREMVEVRHALIGRRGKLREQLEYNKEVAELAGQRIKDLAKAYPQYSREIAGIVERYEGNIPV